MNISINENYSISHKGSFTNNIKSLKNNKKFIYNLKGATGTGCALMGLYGAINKQTALAALGIALAAFWTSTMNKKS